ncbi:LamG domain-containing protein [Kitasatospora sp. NPDC058965]|uniref:LamG domain-containing protein n=1 Tax=Kitasatospora sp. NPDC058965 TaxID=3346682 RepID=UPI0036D0DCDD
MSYSGEGPYGGAAGPVQFGGGGPDWNAMAAEHERAQKRSRLLKIGLGAVAVVAVGGVAAAAVALRGSATPGTRPAAAAGGVPSTATGAGTAGTPSPATSASPAGPQQLPDGQGANPLTVESSAAVGQSDGHSGPTLVLGGSPAAFAQTPAAVVDTRRSFTVSAVVRNDAPAGSRSAVSQGSGSYYSFNLGRDYWGAHNQWAFKVQTAAGDADNNTREAFSPANATVGQWTLLTGVYDAQAKTISLYVDGALAQTSKVSGIWDTSGPLEIGRTRYHSAWVDTWNGAIGDVQLWDRALPASAVAQLHTSGGTSTDAPPIASWLLH